MKKMRKILLIIFVILFLLSLCGVLFALHTRNVANNDNDEGKDIAHIPEMTTASPDITEEPDTEPLIPDTSSSPTQTVQGVDEYANTLLVETDIASLKAQNSDVVGWIVIPDTNISFPLVYSEVKDFYFNRTWLKNWSLSGSIYLDSVCDTDFVDYNTIIHGHNMGAGEMFSDLLLYREQNFYNDHPSIYIVTENSVRRYDIFSVYESELEVDITYRVEFENDEKKAEFLKQCKDNSEIFCDDPKKGANVITLSTCTYTGKYDYETRWVVQGYLAYYAVLSE